jgi:fermentation-respiration switch protein FrsA (DUF1100 family)
MKSAVLILLSIAALAVVAPMLVTLVACRSFLYHPTADIAAAPAGWKTLRLRVAPDVELAGVVRAPASADARWFLMFGGNASPISGNREILNLVDSTGTSGLAVFSYRGYDESDGVPAESSLKSDARAIARYLEETSGLRPEQMVLVGQSLGSGVASFLAAELSREGRAPHALVLLSPYTSIARVFDDMVPLVPVGWAVSDRWDTAALAEKIACPVVIVHGQLDRLIGVEHGRSLKRSFGARARLVELEGAGHNDLFSDPRTIAAIRSVL